MSSRTVQMEPVRGARRRFLGLALVLFLWLLGWVWWSSPYMLDDALIHLRYADNLGRYGRITYDGVHASFGTSSLLYVSLLAGLRSVWQSPVLPRVVSSLVYVALFGSVFAMLYRGLRRGGYRDTGALWLAVGLLAILAAPSAVRWLNDGMETGLVLLDVLLGVLLLRQAERSVPGSRWWGLWAFAYGLLTVLLRVELALLVVWIAGMAVLGTDVGQALRRPGRWLPPLAGAGAAVLLISLTMHTLLPDTAVAKAFGPARWRDTFEMTGTTLLSSASFGLGLVLLWLVSLWMLRARGRSRAADAVANLLFPVVFLLAARRGQHIQGIRYFGWTLFFPLLWNWLRLTDSPTPESAGGERSSTPLLTCSGLAIVAVFAWESRAFNRVFAGRNAAFAAFRAQHLEGLRGQLGVAEDVGFVGYFTQGNLCDPYGLVNGRGAAAMTYDERFAHCMAMQPVYAFGNRQFLQKVTHVRSLAGWSVCGTYVFQNVSSADVHYLVVAPAVASLACSAGQTPVAQALPGLL